MERTLIEEDKPSSKTNKRRSKKFLKQCGLAKQKCDVCHEIFYSRACYVYTIQPIRLQKTNKSMYAVSILRNVLQVCSITTITMMGTEPVTTYTIFVFTKKLKMHTTSGFPDYFHHHDLIYTVIIIA
ncbi:hypothetical protein GCK72_004567 [Caenorhabditis remanei]|uniref:Uncharacterized protein n=1 Tax=Caenorhabditis remanei TaxID=31234 RepID=A0A6A5HA33_CAERE|nr:hypothetical protein GCK72_004567 [Caenorhabditis remanei]KAF1764618.1 hypothetical protein GCK72_004567 [Caenorhabditis remanei]